MDKIRCIVCGSSRLDPEGYKCARCGGPIGLRSEAVYVSEETKKILLEHATELSAFGIQIEEHDVLGKDIALKIALAHLVLSTLKQLAPDAVRDVVQRLHELGITHGEILRLRLDEPEQVLKYSRMDKKQGDTAVIWKGPKGSPRVPPSTPSKRGRRKKKKSTVRSKPRAR